MSKNHCRCPVGAVHRRLLDPPPRRTPRRSRTGRRGRCRAAGPPPPAAAPRRRRHGHRGRRRRRRRGAEGPEQHPVEPHRAVRLRQLRRQGTSSGRWSRRTRSTCRPTATRASRCRATPTSAAPRVQHRARPEARRRGEEDDGAAGRARSPDRDGQLRQGEAAGRWARRVGVGAEPPRRNRLRRRMTAPVRRACAAPSARC